MSEFGAPSAGVQPPVAPMTSGPQPPGSKAGCSNGCKTTMVGCGGVVFGIVLTIGVEFWAVAAGVQAVQDAFSSPRNRQYEYPSPQPQPDRSSSADLSRCGSASEGFAEEERDPSLKKACDEERARQRNQKVMQKCVEECTKSVISGGN